MKFDEFSLISEHNWNNPFLLMLEKILQIRIYYNEGGEINL